ncbi:hypothetical protein, partial [Klebsiella pneumoniae]|uniref:hypothetical protein n=1 Tax=Klebsiella pneumoniae TaxID=573 RepID=UPI001C701CB8
TICNKKEVRTTPAKTRLISDMELSLIIPTDARRETGIDKILPVSSVIIFDIFSANSASAVATSFLALWNEKPLM